MANNDGGDVDQKQGRDGLKPVLHEGSGLACGLEHGEP